MQMHISELMKIFTEILKATPINFIVSYFSFIVQTNAYLTKTVYFG